MQPSNWRAGNGTRTRDPNLGKVVLYQLSYSRLPRQNLTPSLPSVYRCAAQPYSGGEGDRTPDLVNAIHALSQLSYAPAILPPPKSNRREHGILSARSSGVKRFHAHPMNIFVASAYHRAPE
jgi:hypothetical protein